MTSFPIVTLTTDFGLADSYAAVMKGVILGLTPSVTVVDVSHLIPPHNILAGAYAVKTAFPYFPAETVHVVVVDPGVGTKRRPIAIRTRAGTFVGPDNGVLGAALLEARAVDNNGHIIDATAVELTEDRYRLLPVSHTFHGRDIFAPAAAHLARGTPLENLGPKIRSLSVAPTTATWSEGSICGRVIHIDRFGNAITNIPGHWIQRGDSIEIAGIVLPELMTTYQDAELGALVGSSGSVEIAARNESFAARFALEDGIPVVVRRTSL